VSGQGARPPTGEQFELAFGHHHVTVTEVGATLRRYTVGDAAVIDGFAVEENAMGGRGQVLAPWPNRLDEGRYTFEGREGRAPLDEPEFRNAIHGLVRWVPWSVVSRSEHEVVLRYALFPQPAYPWLLGLQVAYLLGPDGLEVATHASNLSDGTAPFGLGFHPYLTVGTPLVDEAVLTIPARVRLSTDERGLPRGEVPVAGTDQDFTSPRRVGDAQLDVAYTDLLRGEDGRAVVEIEGPDGRRSSLWMDEGFGYVMVFTGDTVDPPARRRRAIAIEPMTCPPNALATGTDLIRLPPGSMWETRWGIGA
jgi:aldose 1-epimerase